MCQIAIKERRHRAQKVTAKAIASHVPPLHRFPLGISQPWLERGQVSTIVSLVGNIGSGVNSEALAYSEEPTRPVRHRLFKHEVVSSLKGRRGLGRGWAG